MIIYSIKESGRQRGGLYQFLIFHLCDIGRLGVRGTGSNRTQGHHLIQGAAVTAEAGAVAIAEVILGE